MLFLLYHFPSFPASSPSPFHIPFTSYYQDYQFISIYLPLSSRRINIKDYIFSLLFSSSTFLLFPFNLPLTNKAISLWVFICPSAIGTHQYQRLRVYPLSSVLQINLSVFPFSFTYSLTKLSVYEYFFIPLPSTRINIRDYIHSLFSSLTFLFFPFPLTNKTINLHVFLLLLKSRIHVIIIH